MTLIEQIYADNTNTSIYSLISVLWIQKIAKQLKSALISQISVLRKIGELFEGNRDWSRTIA